MVLVPMPTAELRIECRLTVFGYGHARHGHCEIIFENVRVPVSNMLLGEGRGFEICPRPAGAGPGRIHHCMRCIGVAVRALETMCKRVQARVAFGKPLAEQGTIRADIAQSRMEIEQARLLTLNAAYIMDTARNREARAEIAMIKVVAPNVALRVLDRAIQVHTVNANRAAVEREPLRVFCEHMSEHTWDSVFKFTGSYFPRHRSGTRASAAVRHCLRESFCAVCW
jgi:acyl-CoA dehydrogenase